MHPRALANKIAAARYLQLIPFGYRVGREVTSCKTRPQPTSMWAVPAFGERFSDFDATNTRAVIMFRAKVRFDNRGWTKLLDTPAYQFYMEALMH
ncbi:hypothetical protein EJG27_09710 [Shigella dysenteriae]|nr:hypothetical protein [Shigella dysenteriae]